MAGQRDVQPPFEGDSARDDMLILVDGLDREVGLATKWEAHASKLLHRAFSVILTRPGANGLELLLSKRAMGKYHSGGLWANSCCSHPRAGEDVLNAAYRRVREELGCEAGGLREIGAFVYYAAFDNGLAEFEYDHVLIGSCIGEIAPAPVEVCDVRWIGIDALAAELAANPQAFSAWAPMVLSMAMTELTRRA